MRSIGVLQAMRKEKRGARAFPAGRKGLLFLAFLLLVSVAPGASPAHAQGDKTLSTRNNESTITRDPATGDRVMQTPEPKPQQEYEGPQTIIVTPEVYPGGSHGSHGNHGNQGGHRPPRPDRPRPPRQ